MTSEEQLLLSSYIKKIHKELRTSTKTQGVQQAWSEHCQNERALQEYAQCMKRLATEHWDKKHKGDTKNSRNAWIVNQIKEYFTNEMYLSKRHKELREKEKTKLTCQVKTSQFQAPYLLLDVGSCYNPFKDIENIKSIAIDICPASPDVYKCDFLNMKITEVNQNEENNDALATFHPVIVRKIKVKSEEESEFPIVNIIESLNKESFDVVVFSLLLEYIPCSKLRFQCCIKAFHLLKYEGILIIITPDSKHQTSSNVQIMKQWKFILLSIGFKRIKYEKLKHIHCMVFRKSCLVIQMGGISSTEGELLIPQDIVKQENDGLPCSNNFVSTEDSSPFDFKALPTL